MQSATITLDAAFTIAPVRRGTFGSFVEHLGRCVYGGIYEPNHATANSDGFRADVIAMTRELGVSTVRYPGGSFVSGYDWTDGIGPVEMRPARLDLAWHSTEPNVFGLDEFMKWARATNTEPMLAINLGTRGLQDAVNLLEYCNVARGTKWSDLRRSHGVEEPYNVRLWCLGNEVDGPWQLGHKTASEYARLAAETARAMRMVDPHLTLVACGSSGAAIATFGEWEQTVLTEAYDQVDLISAHTYYWIEGDDLGSFLASTVDMDHYVDAVVATCDAVRAQKRAEKKINISLDEWNVWYQQRMWSELPSGDSWPVAPMLLEDRYTMADAVVVGNMLISLLRHSDRVHYANLAQLVNAIAPIVTQAGGPSWKQSIFHPFALTSEFASGQVLRTVVDCPATTTRKFGAVDVIDAVATLDADAGDLVVFAVNRSTDAAIDLTVDVRGCSARTVRQAVTMSAVDPLAAGTRLTADSLVPLANATISSTDSGVRVELPPVSWSMIRLSI